MERGVSIRGKIKLLCSFGGKISDAASDGGLLYVGGTTRVIRISSVTSWEQLKQKTMEMYKQPHTIKYQLPGEDLDVLVSVHCDEDLQDMMAFGVLPGVTGSEKMFRLYLFATPTRVPAQPESKLASGGSDHSWSDPPSRTTSGVSELSHATSESVNDQDIDSELIKAASPLWKKAFAKGLFDWNKGRRKELSPQDAALMIQKAFRAHLVRRDQVNRDFRHLAMAKAKLREIRFLFNNFEYRRRIARDDEEHRRFSEKIIVLLLTVEAIEEADYTIRSAKKPIMEELESMLEVVDPQPPGKFPQPPRKFDS